MTDNKELIPGMTEIMNHIKELEKANKMLNNYNEANIKLRQEKEDKIKELEEENQQQQKWFEEINELIGAKSEDPSVVAVAEYVKKLKEQVVKLQQKATAWDIHNQGDWEYVSQSWDKEQCLELIKCGECKAEDFTHHETFNAEEDN